MGWKLFVLVHFIYTYILRRTQKMRYLGMHDNARARARARMDKY